MRVKIVICNAQGTVTLTESLPATSRLIDSDTMEVDVAEWRTFASNVGIFEVFFKPDGSWKFALPCQYSISKHDLAVVNKAYVEVERASIRSTRYLSGRPVTYRTYLRWLRATMVAALRHCRSPAFQIIAVI